MESDSSTTSADPIVVKSARPRVVERYSAYTPPFDVKALVEKMVESVPPKYLVGLEEILLTNTAGLPRKIRRGMTKSRKKKVRMIEARGLYHRAWNNRPAWIEIYVDNTLHVWQRGWWLRLRFLRESAVGEVLFHEIGHHIHFTVKPEYREREDVADEWLKKLRVNYYRTRRPFFTAFLRVIRPLVRIYSRHHAKIKLARGAISRAQYEKKLKDWR